jgi:predicted GNAT family N-acyltransferase
MASWDHGVKRRPSTSGPTTDTTPATVPAGELVACEIRTLDSVAELTESYRLRYEVYGGLGYLQRFNSSALEIDEYDSSSIPFGAFDTASGEMIGTLRLIMMEVQPDYAHLVRRVLADIGDAELTAQASAPRSHILPSIISTEIDRQIDAFNTDGFVVHELSRTIVRPDHRGSGVSRGLMELGLAYATQLEPSVLVGSCLTEHVPMYARYGYVQLPHTGLDRFDSVGQIARAVVCRTDVLPEPTRSQVDELLRAMGSGAMERELDIGRDSRAVFRFTAPRRPRRRTIEW